MCKGGWHYFYLPTHHQILFCTMCNLKCLIGPKGHVFLTKLDEEKVYKERYLRKLPEFTFVCNPIKTETLCACIYPVFTYFLAHIFISLFVHSLSNKSCNVLTDICMALLTWLNRLKYSPP